MYLVPTPIGNLGDMTYRAVEVLNTVSKILAEDTRTTRVLLNHYQIGTRLESFHQHNEHGKLASVIQELLGCANRPGERCGNAGHIGSGIFIGKGMC